MDTTFYPFTVTELITGAAATDAAAPEEPPLVLPLPVYVPVPVPVPVPGSVALTDNVDIVFQIEMLERMYAFVSLLKKEYMRSFIGGAMLRLDNPMIQHEAGAIDTPHGMKNRKPNFDISDLKYVLKNEEEIYSNYLGWCCCIPREAFEEHGFSLPCFVQYDDIEFSLRNNDAKKITLNGICVWHENFEKKRSSIKDYYMYRNRFLSHAISMDGKGILYNYMALLFHVVGRLFVNISIQQP